MVDNLKEHTARMRLHARLPRQGPGSDSVTEDALRRLPAIPAAAKIYDLGSGPGRASLVLADVLKQNIIAVDVQEEFLNELRVSASQKGLSQLIETRCGDMSFLPDAAGTVDLIWCEGAIYCVGFDAALKAWRPKLTDAGLVACTELSWVVERPSAEPLAFWREAYPGMRSVDENLLAAERLGYKCIEHFSLPESSWWMNIMHRGRKTSKRSKKTPRPTNICALRL